MCAILFCQDHQRNCCRCRFARLGNCPRWNSLRQQSGPFHFVLKFVIKFNDISIVPIKICMNKTCSSIYPYIDRSKCPSNNVALDCSGHGVCSNMNSCFCDAGWTGHDCSTQTNDSYIRSGIQSGEKMGAAEASERDSANAGALGTGAPPPLNGVTTLKPEAQTSNSKTTSYGISIRANLIIIKLYLDRRSG